MLSAGSSLRFKDLFSIFCAFPIGKLHANVIFLGMDLRVFLFCPDACDERELDVFLFVTRGAGFTDS